jgi:hypothetical protein
MNTSIFLYHSTTPIQRQISTQPQSSQQKFFITKASSPASSLVKIQHSNNPKIFIQSTPKSVYSVSSGSSSQETHELDDLSHLE